MFLSLSLAFPRHFSSMGSLPLNSLSVLFNNSSGRCQLIRQTGLPVNQLIEKSTACQWLTNYESAELHYIISEHFFCSGNVIPLHFAHNNITILHA